jgi:alpha-beta hydrolase superfamily lysophospholipase
VLIDGTAETLTGHAGELHVETWPNPDARYVAVLVHGYGEHLGRYAQVAADLVLHGAVVYGPDHRGHGRSAGDRVSIPDFEPVVDDLHLVVQRTRELHVGLPVVLIGHSMGGMIAARYAQRYGGALHALVLSGPVLGRWEAADALLAADEIPDAPIDPATLSRDPDVGEAYVADPLVWHGPFRRETLEAMRTCLATIGAQPPVEELPTLWVHGEDDQLVPIGPTRAGVQALVPPAQLTTVVYPQARHEVFNEINRDEVLADVTRFVDRALRASRGRETGMRGQ